MKIKKPTITTLIAAATLTFAAATGAMACEDINGFVLYEGDHSLVTIGGEHDLSICRDNPEAMLDPGSPLEKPLGGENGLPREAAEKLVVKPLRSLGSALGL